MSTKEFVRKMELVNSPDNRDHVLSVGYRRASGQRIIELWNFLSGKGPKGQDQRQTSLPGMFSLSRTQGTAGDRRDKA